jgi:general secretion pathway protein E
MSPARPARAAPPDQLEALGMPAPVRDMLGQALARRAGLVLIAGPAGSGKKESVEASLAALPAAERSSALAITLTDAACASRAVSAALDGRRVVASIETDGAIAAFARLRDMNVESFLLAAVLRVLVAQRRARRLCPACGIRVQARGSDAALLGFDPGTILARAPGCPACAGTGTGGAVLLFEAIAVDGDVRRMIAAGEPAVIAGHCFRHAPDLASAARRLAREGVIAAEEAIRVSRPQPCAAGAIAQRQ